MNNKYKAMLLSGISSVVLLSGCSSDTNNTEKNQNNTSAMVVTKDSSSDIQYANMVKVFEPGSHIINYYDYVENAENIYNPYGKKDGFIKTNIPSFEGYELFDTQSIIEKCGYGSRSVGMMYVFINNTTVEATGIYNYDKNAYEFYEPGIVVQEKVLK